MKEKNFKSLETIVPDWANWCTVDEDGEISVWDKKPIYNDVLGTWDENKFDYNYMNIGKGPKPKNASKELYKLV